MAKLHVNCLGAFQATLNGEPLAFDTDKTRALLAYLALESTQPQRRERLAGLLWSDSPEKRALHNLRQALSGLRKTLGDEANPIPFLLIQRDTVQFNPESNAWLDAATFENDLATALQHYQNCPENGLPGCRLNLRQLLKAVKLFRGPFLDQMYLNGSPLFDEWASLKREALNQRMIEALTILTELYERRGEISQARQFASQLVALAPWDEAAHTQVMRLLAIEGQWSAAQAQYRHLLRYLRDQMGVEPSAKTVALFENIRKSATENMPLPAQYPPARHSLPSNTTTFVGRENELDAISATLADPCCRLLTLIGPGGVGKTRLALEVTRQQVGIFKDGVFFISLASLSSSDSLADALANSLGFTFFGNESTSDQLLRFIAEKHILWLLDNLEQLLPLSADSLIPRILQNTPGLVIIATSRQRLNLQEECLFPVKGLPHPKQTDSPSSEHFTALQLFANRAQRVQPSFSLENEAHHQAAVLICQLLEGLPLGVELAAAGLWSRTPTEIATSLSGSLRSLASAAINVSDRHRSLWAAFDVSWELLSAEEQMLLARLSVFHGGFEITLAQQGVGAFQGPLASLLDKSLARKDASGRYDLHEAIRQFAAEKLARNATESFKARQGHASAFTSFLAARVPLLKSAGQVQALTELSQEWENIRQAWHWLVDQGCTKEIANCAEAVFHFCSIRTRYQEGITLFAQALGCLEEASAALAKVLTYQGALAYRAFENDVYDVALNQALSLYESLDASSDLALCLVFASGMASRHKNHDQARQLCRRALKICEQTGDLWSQSYALYQLGLLENRIGHMSEAQAALKASLQAARAIGDQRRQIGPLNLLGDLACQAGLYAEGQTYFEESLIISRALDDRHNTIQALINLGTIFHYTEQYDQARRYYEEGLSMAREVGDLGNQSLALVNLGEVALTLQKFDEGLAYFQQGLKLANKANDEWAMLICLINLSDTAIELKDQTTAVHYLSQAIPLVTQLQGPPLMLRTLLQLGRLSLLQKQNEKATALLGLVIHHEATYDELRQVAQQALSRAGLPTPQVNEIPTIDAALKDVLKDWNDFQKQGANTET